MALDSNAEQAEKNRVFKLMEEQPKTYVTATSDLKKGAPMVDGMPIWSEARNIAEAKKWVADYGQFRNGVRSDVAWVGAKGIWAAI